MLKSLESNFKIFFLNLRKFIYTARTHETLETPHSITQKRNQFIL